MYIRNSFESFKRTLWASSEETWPHHWKKLFLKRFFPCMMNATFIQSLVDPSFPSSYPESANESEMIKHNHKHWPNKVMIFSSSLSFKKKTKKKTKKHYQKEKIEMREEKLCLRLMAQPVEKRRKDQKGILKRWKRRRRRKGRREPNLHAASGQQYHHRVNEEKKKEKCAHNPNAFYRSPEKE